FASFAAHHDALDKPDAEHQRDERATAGADEGQRQPGDGHHADVHADGHQRLEEDHRRHAVADQRTGHVGGEPGGPQDAEQHNADQHEHHHRADEAELLGDDGKNVVGVPHPQEAKLALGALHVAFAEQPAVADGRQRLADVVIGVAIQLRVDEHDDAGLLVRLHLAPDDRHRDDPDDGKEQDVPPAHPGGPYHNEPHHEDQHRNAEVGLDEDEKCRD